MVRNGRGYPDESSGRFEETKFESFAIAGMKQRRMEQEETPRFPISGV